MWISKRALITLLAAAIGVSSMAFAGGAFGALGASHPGNLNHHEGGSLIEESLAPSHVTDPVFHGVSPGSLPWALKQGDVRLERSGHDGRLDLQVTGLVIPSMGTPGPVTKISASLYCGANSNRTAADTTRQVPLSREGDASIDDSSFRVPATCLAPVILVHPNVTGGMRLYIALDGWRH